MSTANQVFEGAIADHLSVIGALRQSSAVFERVALKMSEAILSGNKILWCGNGGSAADAQHLAAELVGRFCRERRGLPSIALTANTSTLTAIGNDYGYEHVFRRQVEAICSEGDIVVGISTSGNSVNVCLALETAREMGAFTIAFTGIRPSRMSEIAHTTVQIPSNNTPRIQEAHILFGHMLCDYVESAVCLAAQAGVSSLSQA